MPTQIISYDLLEDDIVARIAPQLQNMGFEVTAFPDKEKDQDRPVGYSPRITVAYAGSNFGDSSDTRNPFNLASGIVAQTEYCDLIISFEAQNLRTNNGLYEAARRTYQLLLGHAPKGWHSIMFKKNEFIRKEQGVYTFYLTATTYRFIVEAKNELGIPVNLDGTPTEADPPNFTQGKINLSAD